MKIAVPLAKIFLAPLGITATALATDAHLIVGLIKKISYKNESILS